MISERVSSRLKTIASTRAPGSVGEGLSRNTLYRFGGPFSFCYKGRLAFTKSLQNAIITDEFPFTVKIRVYKISLLSKHGNVRHAELPLHPGRIY